MSEIEVVLSTIKEGLVYRIGPRPSVEGYISQNWKAEDNVWTGRVTIIAKGSKCFVKLDDPIKGTVFARTEVTETGPQAFEKVRDSMRYFVLRLDDGKGHSMPIGLGFQDRQDAFDFSHTISKHFKQQRDLQTVSSVPLDQIPTTDYSLKEGEKIQFNLKLKPSKSKDTPTTTLPADSGFLPPPDTEALDPVPTKHVPTPIPSPEAQAFYSQQAQPSAQSSDFDSFFTSQPFQTAPPPSQPGTLSQDDLMGFFGQTSTKSTTGQEQQPSTQPLNVDWSAFTSASTQPSTTANDFKW
ncbi:putative Adaptin ear-binding coat-associated protein 2 [Blattamonas nauphoetae]|uniref:Adaptin ear-binding coat-associated protein 2 n=1 Tax=Blattamonas nauphoetae TaxID=2049346 RepID=A0ABQ9XR29_9EUKA|nr:putative Adaptin ear-binding coat-associated protein 2 [Blattamonas nauphoetae]